METGAIVMHVANSHTHTHPTNLGQDTEVVSQAEASPVEHLDLLLLQTGLPSTAPQLPPNQPLHLGANRLPPVK